MIRKVSLSRRGLLGRRVLRRFLYAQMQLRNLVAIAFGRDHPLVRFTVEGDPPSIYLVFPIEDPDGLGAALDLPAPHRLAPIRCVEGEEPRLYLTLNVYRVSGITNGLRAEWSVYVTDIDGVPRYMVVDARSSSRSMDPVEVITPPSRTEYARREDRLEMTIGEDPHAFRATCRIPDDAPRVVTAREWSTANDLIFWRNGVCDRTFYDGGMADAEAVDLDPASVDIEDGSPWSAFIGERPAHVLVFCDAIELVVSPWHNVDDL